MQSGQNGDAARGSGRTEEVVAIKNIKMKRSLTGGNRDSAE